MRTLLMCSAAVVALSVAVVPAMAADAVETVVVSATRSEQPVEKTGASISVLSGEALEARQIAFLSEALADVAGVSVNRTGGPGQTTTVSLRGAEQGQTVTLIDGVRIGDPSETAGGVLFGDLLLNNVARVEVLRGPQSALYGSDAMGGVIDVLTKRGGPGLAALTASAEYGSFDTRRLNAAVNGTVGAVEYGAAVNDYATAGISAADRRNGNAEADGVRNTSATVNTRTHIGAGISLDLRGYVSHAHTDFDDSYGWLPPYALSDSPVYSTHTLYAGYAGINAELFGGRLRNRLALISTKSDRDTYDSSSDTLHHNFAFTGNAERIEYQGIVAFDPDTELTFGAESELSAYTNDKFYSYMPTDHAAGHKRTTGGYGQIQHTLFSQLTLTAGVRYESDAEFGSHTSWKVAGAWNVPGWDATLRANVADGFKAPSLYQLYSAYSNPVARLAPERATAWEVGLDKHLFAGKLTAALTYFDRRSRDQIDFLDCYSAPATAGCDVRPYGYYINLGRSRASGLEVSVQAALTDSLSFNANYTTMRAYNRITGFDLARRPQETAYAAITWAPLSGLSLGTDVQVTGKRFNDGGQTTPMGAYESAGLFASYDVAADWQVFGRIDNLFNDRTERVPGYGTPGMAASFGIRLRANAS